MRVVSPLNYAYAIGRIRALERRLLSRETLAKMIDADPADAMRLLTETGFGGGESAHIGDGAALEALLEKERRQLAALVDGLLLDDDLRPLLANEPLPAVPALLRRRPRGFLADFLRQWIDVENLRTFVRRRLLEDPPERLAAALLPEGNLSEREWLTLYSLDTTALLHRLEYVRLPDRLLDYRRELGEAVQATLRERSFSHLEKSIHDFFIARLKPAKFMAFGPEPLLAFYFARRNEIDLVRLVMLGKINDVPVERLKNRINDVYTAN